MLIFDTALYSTWQLSSHSLMRRQRKKKKELLIINRQKLYKSIPVFTHSTSHANLYVTHVKNPVKSDEVKLICYKNSEINNR
jgi:hypothetical protein